MRTKVIVIAIVFVSLLATLCISYWVHLHDERNSENAKERILVEVSPPFEVYDSEFLYHPESWNKVIQNVSTIPDFWNATIPENLQNKALSQIAQMFSAQVSHSDADYAYCYISVPKAKCQALNQTLMQIGFNVEPTEILKPNNALILTFTIITYSPPKTC